MAVVNTRSTYIGNAESVPPVISQGHLHRGRMLSSVGTVSVAATDQANSTYRFTRLKSSERVISAHLTAEALGGSAAVDISLYDTEDNGGALVSSQFFASAVAIATAITRVDVTHEQNTVYTVAKREKRVWEVLGLSADPQKDYDVVGKLTADAASAGTMTLDLVTTSGP